MAGVAVQNSWSGGGDQKRELGSRAGQLAGASPSVLLPGPRSHPTYFPSPADGSSVSKHTLSCQAFANGVLSA